MSPGNPHLHQLDSCSEEHQSNALQRITVRITKPECHTSEKEILTNARTVLGDP